MSAPLLVFDRAHDVLHILNGKTATSWLAGNNVDSHSRGPWPRLNGYATAEQLAAAGVFRPELLVRVGGPDGDLGGKYGPVFVRYIVPGRVGMALHAGREGDEDGMRRAGPLHATLGCIRSSATAVEEVARLSVSGELPLLWVPR